MARETLHPRQGLRTTETVWTEAPDGSDLGYTVHLEWLAYQGWQEDGIDPAPPQHLRADIVEAAELRAYDRTEIPDPMVRGREA